MLFGARTSLFKFQFIRLLWETGKYIILYLISYILYLIFYILYRSRRQPLN